MNADRFTTHLQRTQTAHWRSTRLAPGDDLGALVLAYWELDGEFPPGCERELPRGDVSIIINLAGRHSIVDRPIQENTFEAAWATGLQTRAFVTECGGRAWLCGVRLTPEGAWRVLGPAAPTFAGNFVGLEACLAGEGAHVIDDVRSARAAYDRLSALDAFVRRRIARNGPVKAPLAWAAERLRRDPGVPVTALADAIGWSRAHLHSVFASAYGASPSLYRRLVRFDAAIKALGPGRSRDRLTDVAYTLGFADQAHFTHDFRAIAGMTPSAYLQRQANSVDYGFAAEI